MKELTILKQLLREFREKLSNLDHIVTRDASFADAPNKIKVAIGMRRTGKTYFLYQQIRELLAQGVDKDAILFINFEDDRLLPLNQETLAQLVEAFYTLYPENYEKTCHLFFDEIQNVPGWELVIRRLYDTKKAQIYITGSSAKLLSKEIATSLRGRSLATEIWPYSFQEFMQAKEITIDRDLYTKKTEDKLRKAFLEYLSIGGFPEVTHYSNDVRKRTLQEYLEIVIYRDILERHSIANASLIKYMIVSMIHNTSKPFSVNKFYNDAKSQGYRTGKDALYDYINYIEDAFLSFSVPLHDRSIRRVETNPKKLYAIDPGLVRAVTLNYETELGKLFENVIYLDLRRLGCTIHYYLTKEDFEIDFLVQAPDGKKKLFQVAWHTDDPKTLEREERALKSGMKELGIDGELITLNSYLEHGIIFNR